MLLAFLLATQAAPANAVPDELDQYRACFQREAMRLEPSRETPEDVMKGADMLCSSLKRAFSKRMLAEWNPNKSLTKEQHQKVVAAMVNGAELWAKDTAFLPILEKRLVRHTGK